MPDQACTGKIQQSALDCLHRVDKHSSDVGLLLLLLLVGLLFFQILA
jgi:hypothetical protein